MPIIETSLKARKKTYYQFKLTLKDHLCITLSIPEDFDRNEIIVQSKTISESRNDKPELLTKLVFDD